VQRRSPAAELRLIPAGRRIRRRVVLRASAVTQRCSGSAFSSCKEGTDSDLCITSRKHGVRMSPTTSAPVRWRPQWSAEVLFPWLAPWLPPSQLGRHLRTDPRGAEVGGWASRLVLRRGQRGIGQGVPHDVATGRCRCGGAGLAGLGT
jgi:hypothetical protein